MKYKIFTLLFLVVSVISIFSFFSIQTTFAITPIGVCSSTFGGPSADSTCEINYTASSCCSNSNCTWSGVDGEGCEGGGGSALPNLTASVVVPTSASVGSTVTFFSTISNIGNKSTALISDDNNFFDFISFFSPKQALAVVSAGYCTDVGFNPSEPSSCPGLSQGLCCGSSNCTWSEGCGGGGGDIGFYNFFQVATDPENENTIEDLPRSFTGTLMPSQSRVTSVPYTFDTAGIFYVRACADKSDHNSTGTISESNEIDNCGSWAEFSVIAPVTCSETHYGCEGGVGTTSENNLENETSWSWTCNIPDDTGEASSCENSYAATWNLPPTLECFNETISCSPTEECKLTGEYAIIYPNNTWEYTATWDQNVRNCGERAICVPRVSSPSKVVASCTEEKELPPGPDLVINLDIPPTANKGMAFSALATIKNQGTDSTNGSFGNVFQTATQFWPHDNKVAITTLDPSISASTLAPDKTSDITKSITFNSSGFFSIRACADVKDTSVGPTEDGLNDYIPENNEKNNCSAWKNIEIKNPPELTLPDLTVGNVFPPQATKGELVNYSAIISNIGNRSAIGPGNKISHLFQFDDDSDDGSISGVRVEDTTGIIISGGYKEISTSYSFSSAGNKRVRVCADNNKFFIGSVVELDEFPGGIPNNCGPWTPVVVTGDITGTLKAVPSSCEIEENKSSCSTALEWSTIPSTVVPASGVTTDKPNVNTPVATGNSDSKLVSVAHGGQTFFLFNNTEELARVPVRAECISGTDWIDGICMSENDPRHPRNRVGLPSLTVKVLGRGTVSSTPPGINNCSTECMYRFNSNSSVTLNASESVTWGGNCSGVGTSYSITMNGSKTCTATFLNGGAGICGVPPKHYICPNGGLVGGESSNIKTWTWTCNGFQCSEDKKAPQYEED